MSTIKFALFLFYRYYKRGRWETVPYFHTLSSMSFLLFLNVATILGFLDKEELLFSNGLDSLAIPFLLIYGCSLFVFWMLLKKKTLDTMEYEPYKIRRGNWLLAGYVIFSILGMILSIAE